MRGASPSPLNSARAGFAGSARGTRGGGSTRVGVAAQLPLLLAIGVGLLHLAVMFSSTAAVPALGAAPALDWQPKGFRAAPPAGGPLLRAAAGPACAEAPPCDCRGGATSAPPPPPAAAATDAAAEQQQQQQQRRLVLTLLLSDAAFAVDAAAAIEDAILAGGDAAVRSVAVQAMMQVLKRIAGTTGVSSGRYLDTDSPAELLERLLGDARPPLGGSGGDRLCALPMCAPPALAAASEFHVEAAGSPARGAVGVIAQPPPHPPAPHALELPDGRVVDGRFSHQTCYLGGDESELCELHGTVCLNGAGVVVVNDEARVGALPEATPMFDASMDCVDYRHLEPSDWHSSKCTAAMPAGRQWRFSTEARQPLPATDHPLDVSTRYVGPVPRRGMETLQAAPADVFPDVGRGWAGVEELGRTAAPPPPTVPGLRLFASAVSASGAVTVDFLHPAQALWLVTLLDDARYNPFAWMSSAAPLFAAQRANASPQWGAHPADGYLRRPMMEHSQGRVSLTSRERASNTTSRHVSGPQWGPLPPMDVVAFLGAGGRQVPDAQGLAPWQRFTWELLAQRHSLPFFADLAQAYGPKRLLCARRGVMASSSKAKFFSSHADAWLFRQYAYNAARSADGALDVPEPHPLFPPPRIMIAHRMEHTGRFIFNRAEVERLVARIAAEAGVAFEVVEELGQLPPAAQVAAMARTGILIAPHGAALANAMFLPQHAVLVELQPPLHQRDTYGGIAHMAGLKHVELHCRDRLVDGDHVAVYGAKLQGEPAFQRECLGPGAPNMSGFDALLLGPCAMAIKAMPLVVPQRVLRRVLVDALDAIGVPWTRNPGMLSRDPDVEETPELQEPRARFLQESLSVRQRQAAAAAAAAAAQATPAAAAQP